MKRRDFIKTSTASGLALAAFPIVIIKSLKTNSMDRIGLTTVVFRDRFQSPNGGSLVLRDVPEYFADRFGIHNVELWTQHFESKSKAYLSDIKKALKKSKSTLIDIQVDTKNDLSNPDDEIRQKAIFEMKEWIDAGKTLDTKFIRISPMKKSYEKSAESITEIVAYASTNRISTLVENHNDMYSNVEKHLNIRKEITDKDFGLLADFGNYPASVDTYNALQQIAPFTKLVSAKAKDFDGEMNHIPYDFGKCIRIFEQASYRGIYSLEQWGKPNPDYDYEKITDWMIETVKENT